MEDNLKDIFASNLRKQLALHDKKQSDLAKYLGVSTPTVSEWCNGKKMPRTDKIQSICNWLFIEMDDLLKEHSTGENKKSIFDDDQVVCYSFDREFAEIAREVMMKPFLKALFNKAKYATKGEIEIADYLLDKLRDERLNATEEVVPN